jgi:hypothetical protein
MIASVLRWRGQGAVQGAGQGAGQRGKRADTGSAPFPQL